MTTTQVLLWTRALRVTLVGMTAMFSSAAQSSENHAWKEFTLDDKSFSISMPGAPKSKEVHNNSFIGDVVTHEYYLDDGLDSYSIEFTDLPGFAVSFSGDATIYEHAKGALLKNTLSKSIAFTDITLNGVHGKKLLYDTPTKPGHPEMQGEARFFMVENRLYTADAVVEMSKGSDKLTRFFSSLEVKP